MSTLQISEYESLVSVAGGDIAQVPLEPAIATQSVTYSAGTSAASLKFHAATRYVAVATDASTDANVVFGKKGVKAGPSGSRIPQDSVRFFGVDRKSADRLAVL